MTDDTSPRGLEAFDEVKRAMVVAAHADDMETMMGGTLLRLRERGVAFVEIICTAGDRGSNEPQWTRATLAATRIAEARRAAALAGVGAVEFLGHPDGELLDDLALRATLAGYYRRFQPDALFTFDPTGFLLNHPDHRAVARAALDALIPSKMRLYQPEQLSDAAPLANVQQVFLWTPATPNVVVDVAAVYEQKLALCRAHASQFPAPDSLDWMKRLDGDRGGRSGTAYAEAFGALRTF